MNVKGGCALVAVTILYVLVTVLVDSSNGAECRGLSADVKCQCNGYGRCEKGTVDVDPWLQFALKTQRELQVDLPVDRIQIFGAHNAYNNRAYGPVYGANDTCNWPPPYDGFCLGLANHEFGIIDMLNMGVRSLEIDSWYCAGAMRVAHLGTPYAIWCGDFNVRFDDVIADIGQWMDARGNEEEYVRLYFNEKYPQGHDSDVNGALERYLGHDQILSPADLRDTYKGVWPTMRQLRQDGKRYLIVSHDDTLHQGKYIHEDLCSDSGFDAFTNYPQCGGKSETKCQRYHGDATHYVFDVVYDGPSSSGAMLDLSEQVKCRINIVSTDMVNPQMMETAVYTWAKGEPSLPLHEQSCVMLSHEDFRWYTSSDCSQSLSYACQSTSDPNAWLVSESTGPYDVTQAACPIGYKFSVPQNGFRQQKLKEAMGKRSVWLNYTPWITGNFPTPEAIEDTTTRSSSAPPTIRLYWILVFTTSFLIAALTVCYPNVAT